MAIILKQFGHNYGEVHLVEYPGTPRYGIYVYRVEPHLDGMGRQILCATFTAEDQSGAHEMFNQAIENLESLIQPAHPCRKKEIMQLNTPEVLVIEGVAEDQIHEILSPLRVIEYDLRVMRRDLLDMMDLSSSVEIVVAQIEYHVDQFVDKADPAEQSLYSNEEYSRVVAELALEAEQMQKKITTLACDTFTAAIDLENYSIDLRSSLGNAELLEYYLRQARMCYTKANLLLAPVGAAMERLHYLKTLVVATS